MVHAALVVALVDAGRTCGVRVVLGRLPYGRWSRRGRDPVVAALITPSGPDAGGHVGGRGDHSVVGPQRSRRTTEGNTNDGQNRRLAGVPGCCGRRPDTRRGP